LIHEESFATFQRVIMFKNKSVGPSTLEYQERG